MSDVGEDDVAVTENNTVAEIADAARQLREILAAVERGDLQAGRGERDRLRGAVVTLEAIAEH